MAGPLRTCNDQAAKTKLRDEKIVENERIDETKNDTMHAFLTSTVEEKAENSQTLKIRF